MRRKSGQDVLDRAVFVHVASHTEGGEVAHLFRARNRPTEYEDRQPALIDLADGPHEIDAAGMRKAKIEYDQIDACEVGAHTGQQFSRALDGEGGMARAEQGRGETVPHEGGVVGDDNGFVCGHVRWTPPPKVVSDPRVCRVSSVAEFIRFSL
jgi:hypothetical protein